MKIIVPLRLLDALVRHYLRPILALPEVREVVVVRHAAVPDWHPPKLRWSTLGLQRDTRAAVRLPGLAKRLGQLLQSEQFDWLLTFNPIPYALLTPMRGGRVRHWHAGFIGNDWYLHCKGRGMGWVLRQVLRRADAITGTGPSMVREMAEGGFPADRVHVLPHAIDLDRFPLNPAPPEDRRFDLVFVGQLIGRKRVDRILHAVRLLRDRRPGTSLVVVGDGPACPDLQRLAAEFGLSEAVHFAGHQMDVNPWLQQSRLMMMASSTEGFPFAMVEAMAAGVVPIAPDVGTIRDELSSGCGRLVSADPTPEELAEAALELLEPDGHYTACREQLQKDRPGWDISAAMAVWRNILGLDGAAHG